MAFFELVCTASKLKKLKDTLVEEKNEAIKISKKEKAKRRFGHFAVNLQLAIRKFLKKILNCCSLDRFCYKLRRDGSCENYLLKSIVGFISGFVLTYIFFMFFVFQLNFMLPTATVMCSILGCILTIGLAFSTKVRCIVLLTLPQFFSQRGRQALLAYAFILAISGPVRNTLNNMGILSESLACGQEQLKSAVRQIIDVIKKPFIAIKEAIKKVVKTVKEIIKKIKEILLTIKRIIMAISYFGRRTDLPMFVYQSINAANYLLILEDNIPQIASEIGKGFINVEVKVIKAAFQFLAKIINVCNKELGTPFERCTRVFENAIVDCNAKLGPLFNWLCSITYIVKTVCYLVKIFDYICMLIDFISNSIIGVVIRKIKIFIRHVRTMFYVRIKFSHSFQFETITSKTLSEVTKEIVAEIKQRTRVLVALFKFMTSAATLFFLFIIIKVTYYRYRFLTSEKFDNKYITKDFRALDLRRAKLGKETVLPLNKREVEIYASVDSKKLIKTEKKALSKATTTLATANVKLAILIAADYCLYWILNLIKYYGRFQSKVQAPNIPRAHISGNGLLADLLRSIVLAFEPVGITLEIDTVPCLPTPVPPDYDRYVQIATLILLCWFLTLLEPYGLRLRHMIMCYYHPTRAKQRSIWLYNHIMRSRNSFLKFARRQLRRKVFGGDGIAKVTCKEYLAANFAICRVCLGEGAQTACLLCGEVFRESDDKKPIKCQTPDCPGVYCEQCFADLQNLCTVCLSPIEYGDLSDISEEKDSSEEEPRKPTTKASQKKQSKSWCCKICKKCFSRSKEEEETGDEDYTPKPKKQSWFKRKFDSKTYSSENEEENLLQANAVTDSKEGQKYSSTNTKSEDKKPIKAKDSDYYSSDNSTDYSYSYQYDKSQYTQPLPRRTPFRDVEKQDIPDYASMNCFRPHADTEATLPQRGRKLKNMIDQVTCTTPVKRSASTIISGTTLMNNKKGRHVDFVGVPDKTKILARPNRGTNKEESKEEEMPLIDTQLSSSDTDSELMQKYQTPIVSLPRSTIMTSSDNLCLCYSSSSDENEASASYSSIDSEIRGDLRYIQSAVTDVDLSQLTEHCTCKNYTDSVFSNVTYDEISESPRSSSSSKYLTSSTAISSLKDELYDAPSEEKPTDIPVKTKSSTKLYPKVPSSSTTNYDFESNQRKKVKQYYKAVKDVPGRRIEEKRKPGKIMRFLRKIFPKRKKNLDVLPLYSTESKDVIELKSYNYSQDNWDTLSASVYSSTYIRPENSTNTENTTSSEEETEQSRIRGGECEPTQTSYHIVKQDKIKQSANLASHQIGDACLEDFFNYSSAAKHTELVPRDLLSKYFVSIEDLTPTRDCDIPMNTVEVRKPSSLTNKELLRELPEKDATQPQVIPVIESDSYKSARSYSSISNNVKASSSSNLSIDLCANILGGPCPPIKGRDSKSVDNTSDIQRDTKLKANEDKLSTISETEPSPTTNEANQNRNKSLKSKENSQSQTQKDNLDTKEAGQREQSRSHSEKPERCVCELFSRKTQKLQTCPTPILKYRCITDTEADTMDSPRRDIIRNRSGDTADSFCVYSDKYPVRENRISPESRQNLFFTSDKMQQTSDNDVMCRSSPRTCPTTTNITLASNKAHASSNTISESTRPPTICACSGNCSFVESNETQQSSSIAYGVCRRPERHPADTKCGCTCCNYPPPPPPRYEDYVGLQERNYRELSPPNTCPKYDARSEKCLKDEPSEYNLRTVRDTSTSTRTCRDIPVDSGYSLRESQYNEFKKDPTDSFTTQCTRRCRPPDGDGPRRRKPSGSIIICACNGDCRCCKKKHNAHTCQKYRSQGYNSSSSDFTDSDEEENYLPDSHPTCFELPYQNNEDYLELVQELEETLQSRNRNRVRRAMQEFEHRSKYNKPLERPITDYDETIESERPLIQKISQLTSEKKRCCAGNKCTCRRKKPKSREKQRPKSGGYPCGPRYRHRSPSESNKTHWQIDTNSGEWYKVSGNLQGCKDNREYCPYDCNCCTPKIYDYR